MQISGDANGRVKKLIYRHYSSRQGGAHSQERVAKRQLKTLLGTICHTPANRTTPINLQLCTKPEFNAKRMQSTLTFRYPNRNGITFCTGVRLELLISTARIAEHRDRGTIFAPHNKSISSRKYHDSCLSC